MISWITENINKFVLETLQAIFEFFSTSLIKMFNLGVSITQTKNVVNITKVTSGIAIGLITVLVLKEILSTYVTETNGDPDSDPLQVIVRGLEAIAAVSCQSWLFNYLLKVSEALSKDITSGGIKIEEFKTTFGDVINNANLVNKLNNIGFLVLFFIFLLILIFMLCFKAILRGVELALCRILFPLFSISLCGTSRERFNSFLSTYLVTFFGYIIQVFCFEMGLANVIKALAYTTFDEYILAIAWLWFALKTPKWLEKFAYSSGLKNTVTGAARTAFFMGRMPIR